MRLSFWTFDLRLRHNWTVANAVVREPRAAHVVFVRLVDCDGVVGTGEAAPSMRYGEDCASVARLFERVDAGCLSFEDLAESMAVIEAMGPGNFAAKAALNMALIDGAARRGGQPAYAFLGLTFSEGRHVTSFSIGMDSPEAIRAKVLDAAQYPILKLKLGSATDRENLAALRSVAPDKLLRLDANEAWPDRETALRNIEWLAHDRRIEMIEQPMPASRPIEDFIWIKERSPLPVYADESFHASEDVAACAAGFHGVNVKLIKTGGMTRTLEALRKARSAGLKTMIGCMVESSLAISAAAHLCDSADRVDLDGNLLAENDPYRGVSAEKGVLSFAAAPALDGLMAREINSVSSERDARPEAD
jgi:L-alanine-DL-glutamate epimerase-like enolase superfamily enzyme